MIKEKSYTLPVHNSDHLHFAIITGMCRYHCIALSGDNGTFLSESYDGKSIQSRTK